MSPQRDDFETKTHAELSRLTAEAAGIRAKMPNHRPCPDKGACRHCGRIRDIHTLVNDHIDQLRGDTPNPVQAAAYTVALREHLTVDPFKPICRCGQERFGTDAIVCGVCDYVYPNLGLAHD